MNSLIAVLKRYCDAVFSGKWNSIDYEIGLWWIGSSCKNCFISVRIGAKRFISEDNQELGLLKYRWLGVRLFRRSWRK
jgi:hypothetical protein